MSAELLRFEKRRVGWRPSGHRLSAILAVAFIVVYGAIALGTLFLRSHALPGAADLYPGL